MMHHEYAGRRAGHQFHLQNAQIKPKLNLALPVQTFDFANCDLVRPIGPFINDWIYI